MNKLVDGTTYRTTQNGIVLVRGKRELYLQGTSIEQTEKAHKLIATKSFNKLFTAGKKHHLLNNTAYINL